MARGNDVFCLSLLCFALTLTALIPLSFFLINSLSPGIIHTLSLVKIKGEFLDPDPAASQPINIILRVGPTGGCVWSNMTNPMSRSCISQIPFRPSPEFFHLPSNYSDITSVFHVGLGRALALNHVSTALMGLSTLAVVVDCLILEGGISMILVHITIFIAWLTWILETVYIAIIHKRLDTFNAHHQHEIGFQNWQYDVGEGYWFVLAATIFISIIINCGKSLD